MTVPIDPQQSVVNTSLDVLDKIVKILAVTIGGFWALVNYLRGRTFKRRLEPTIKGALTKEGDCLVLTGTVGIKNVGLSKVCIEQKGTAIEALGVVLTEPCHGDKAKAAETSLAVLPVFEKHAWVEPGEPIQEGFWEVLPLKPGLFAVRLKLRIVSKGVEWNTNSLVQLGKVEAESDSAQSSK